MPLARALGIDADWSLYDVVVFTMEEFVLPGLQARRMAFIPPAIDPLSTKNMELPDELCVEVIANAGVDITRPLVTQVSRFDPWKDPKQVASDDDIYVFTNLAGVGSMEVNAFQRACDLVIQKSLREGFGLVVSESFWKGKPVVAGRAGGIPMQFPAGYDRYLVEGVEACAERMVELLGDPEERRRFGEAAREHVRQGYLLPRLLRDDLALIKSLIGGR